MRTNLGHSRDMPKKSLRIWKLTNPSNLLKLRLLLRAACADVARTAKAEARNAARAEARASAEARAEARAEASAEARAEARASGRCAVVEILIKRIFWNIKTWMRLL